MTEFKELHSTISAAVDTAIAAHFQAKEKSAVAKFKEARKQRGKKRTAANRSEAWHETYVIQVARTMSGATIKVEGIPTYYEIAEPWFGQGTFNVRENGKGIIDESKNLESLIQRTIVTALSNAYLVVIE